MRQLGAQVENYQGLPWKQEPLQRRHIIRHNNTRRDDVDTIYTDSLRGLRNQVERKNMQWTSKPWMDYHPKARTLYLIVAEQHARKLVRRIIISSFMLTLSRYLRLSLPNPIQSVPTPSSFNLSFHHREFLVQRISFTSPAIMASPLPPIRDETLCFFQALLVLLSVRASVGLTKVIFGVAIYEWIVGGMVLSRHSIGLSHRHHFTDGALRRGGGSALVDRSGSSRQFQNWIRQRPFLFPGAGISSAGD